MPNCITIRMWYRYIKVQGYNTCSHRAKPDSKRPRNKVNKTIRTLLRHMKMWLCLDLFMKDTNLTSQQYTVITSYQYSVTIMLLFSFSVCPLLYSPPCMSVYEPMSQRATQWLPRSGNKTCLKSKPSLITSITISNIVNCKNPML